MPGASSFDRVTCANGSGRLVDCVLANETVQRKTPTNARTAMPGTPIMWSPGPLLDRRRLTFPSEQYGGIEYGGLPVKPVVLVITLCCSVFQIWAASR